MLFAACRPTALLALVTGVLAPGDAGAAGPERPQGPALVTAPRFGGRLQVLSGAALALPTDAAGDRALSAYVPLDVELAFRVTGPVALGLGAAGYLAPFAVPACPAVPAGTGRDGGDTEAAQRGGAAALSAYLDARLDFHNSRDGSWLNPWLALRAGVVGQGGSAAPVPASRPGALACTERVALGPFLSPRAGLDLWMGPAAVTFSVGYEPLPRAAAVSAQVGLTVRLF